MTTTANLVITFDETVDVESGDNDNIVGTSYNDVIFGDGSGGGGGGSKHRLAAGGNSGSGSDNIDGGAGNDIIFGDGFKGNDNDTTDQLTPVSVSGLTGATKISSRGRSACAIVGGNAVMCWGRNDVGQLGSTDTYDRLTPIQVGE